MTSIVYQRTLVPKVKVSEAVVAFDRVILGTLPLGGSEAVPNFPLAVRLENALAHLRQSTSVGMDQKVLTVPPNLLNMFLAKI